MRTMTADLFRKKTSVKVSRKVHCIAISEKGTVNRRSNIIISIDHLRCGVVGKVKLIRPVVEKLDNINTNQGSERREDIHLLTIPYL